MIKETMTREQRLLAAVSSEAVDRVPVSSMFDDFALRQKGVPRKFGGDAEHTARILRAYHEIFEDLGGYDYQWHAGPGFAYSSWHGSMDMAVNSVPPGQDSAAMTPEREALTFEDYDKIINLGWNGFCREFYPRVTGLSLEQIDAMQQKQFALMLEDRKWWEERGVPVLMGGMTMNCEMILSLGRTLTQFTLDLYRHPDKIQAVIEAMVDDCTENALRNARATGIPWANILLARGSSTFYNIPTFERFIFPYLKKMVEAFISAGLFVNMHLDTNWILNLPYFKEFPKNKCIVELDSTTDIFKAKEILKGHMCIKGDVPATILSLGKPEDVAAYCKKLIDIVGKGGGFILSTGCTCPVDAKFENVKAMVDTAKNYYPH
jgi:uroporphyrinogen-III decarboxylase